MPFTIQAIKDVFSSCFNRLRGKKNKSDDEENTTDLEAAGAEGDTAGGVDNASMVIHDEGRVQGNSFCSASAARPIRPAPPPPLTNGDVVDDVNVPPPQLGIYMLQVV